MAFVLLNHHKPKVQTLPYTWVPNSPSPLIRKSDSPVSKPMNTYCNNKTEVNHLFSKVLLSVCTDCCLRFPRERYLLFGKVVRDDVVLSPVVHIFYYTWNHLATASKHYKRSKLLPSWKQWKVQHFETACLYSPPKRRNQCSQQQPTV